MRMCLISVFSVLLFALAGCGTSQGQATDIPNLPPSSPKEIGTLPTSLPTLRTQEDDMPEDPPLTISESPGPPVLIESAKADLAQRLSIPTSQIQVIETKEVAWPDASLGCPQLDTIYAQITTHGYIVVLEYAGNEFEYHAGIPGNAFYCENPTPPISESPAEIYPFRTPTP